MLLSYSFSPLLFADFFKWELLLSEKGYGTESHNIPVVAEGKIDLLKEIELIVNQTINEYAIRENFDLILYQNIAFVSEEINITQKIIDEIEKLKL